MNEIRLMIRYEKARFARLALMCVFGFLSIAGVFGQNITVKGTILDESGQGIIGASIVTSSRQGTITDINGNFTVQAKANESITISYVGYITQTIALSGKNTLTVTLKEDTKSLEEVVVVGYGAVKKSDVMGALTQVSEKTIKERPVQNAIQAMQGKAAGVDVQSNVRPGEISSVTIRGTRSISATNSPLYVVDGIILMGDMNDVNPNDIASMEILKDASSTAIYGSRGANGVILITTKSGKKGKVSVDYNSTLTLDQINSITKWASAGEMLDRVRLANINGGTYKAGSTAYSYPNPAADISMFGNNDATTIAALQQAYQWNDPGTFASPVMRNATDAEKALGYPDQVPAYNASAIPTTDWVNLLTRTGVTQNHQIGISVGSEISRLYVSLGYYGNEGTQKNQSYKRYSVRLNGDINPTKWLNVGASLNATLSDQKYGSVYRSGSATGPNDAYGIALSQYLMAKPYDENGNMIIYPGNNQSAPTWNPLIDIENTDDLTRRVNIQANAFAVIKFTPWLNYRVNFGAGYRTSNSGNWQGSQSTINRKAASPTANAGYSYGTSFQYLIENILNFNKSFGVHNLGVTLMQSAQYYNSQSLNVSAAKILYDTSKWYNLAANIDGKPSSYGSGFSENSMLSWMARFNYGLMDKYLLTGTIRYDAASVLAPGHKWDYFPSVAIAWKMQNEEFMKNITWINELKLRVGYGVTGNSAVGPYTTSGPLSQYNYAFGAVAAIGLSPLNMPNPNLGWEKTGQMNYGVDFAFLKERISGTLEYYNSNTWDIIMTRSINPVTGFPSIVDNIGKINNSGIEFTVTTHNIENKNFKWTSNFNISANKEKWVETINGKQDAPSNGWYIGQPVSVFRTYVVDGLWQNTPEDLAEIAKWTANGYTFQPGQYKPVELGTPDYKLTDEDKKIVGNSRPKCVIGFTNSFTYKQWEMSVFAYARLGQKYFASLIPAGTYGSQYIGYGRSVDPSEFWSPTNTDAKYPQPTTFAKAKVDDVNRAMNINDGSFLAIRNISLAYNFPERWLKPVSIKSLQVYSQVLNPFLFGGAVVKAGLNPDDTNGWSSTNSVGDATGGTNNNTMMTTSFVFGLRVSL